MMTNNRNDDKDYKWWCNGRWADNNYRYFEEPEKYKLLEENVYNILFYNKKHYLYNYEFQYLKAFFNYMAYLLDNKVDNSQDAKHIDLLSYHSKKACFNDCFEEFINMYMNDSIRYLVWRYYLLDNGLGYPCYSEELRLNYAIDECALEYSFSEIIYSNSSLRKYFEDYYPNVYNFRYFNFNNIKKTEELGSIIPEEYKKYVWYLKDFNEDTLIYVFKKLNIWWQDLKQECRKYLGMHGRLPSKGNILLGNFSSLEDLINKMNEMYILLGRNPLNVKKELESLNTPLKIITSPNSPSNNLDLIFGNISIVIEEDIEKPKANNDKLSRHMRRTRKKIIY